MLRHEWKQMQATVRQYSKPLTIGQILDAFPEESVKLVPRHIRQLRRELRPHFAKIAELREFGDEYAWFLIQIEKLINMPKKKMNHLKQLKQMERLMCKSTRGLTDLDILKSKSVDIWTLHNFNKRHGNMACCPFHADDTPSFSVKRNRFICFGCGIKGDSIDFYMALHKVTFYKAVEDLNRI